MANTESPNPADVAREKLRQDLAEFRQLLAKTPPDTTPVALLRWELGPYLPIVYADRGEHTLESIAKLLKDARRITAPIAVLEELFAELDRKKAADEAKRSARAEAKKNRAKGTAGKPAAP